MKKDNEKIKFNFEKLDVYQKAIDFANDIYKITKQFPKTELFGLINQLRRASLSISLNIAEGSGRYHKKEKKQYYRMARGSVYECIPALTLSLRQELINENEYNRFYNDCYDISRMISGLITSVDNKLK